MLDSTYVNASDPNSMRNIGPTRNCPYVFKVDEQNINTRNNNYDGYLISNNSVSNNTFYSFGGRKSFKRAAAENSVVNLKLLSNEHIHTHRD
jgi:hypothetical protein